MEWNPAVNPRDGLQVMPILTPVSPRMNSSYNVGIPQLRRMQDEMIRAWNAIRIQKQEQQALTDVDELYRLAPIPLPGAEYSVLFRPTTAFFYHHAHYLQVTIRAHDSESYKPWFRYCESKLRVLIHSLETTEVHAWPLAHFFHNHRPTSGSNGETVRPDAVDSFPHYKESHFFIGLRFQPGLDTVDLRSLTSSFLTMVNAWPQRTNTMDFSVCHVTYKHLPPFVHVSDGNLSDDQHQGNGRGRKNKRGDSHHHSKRQQPQQHPNPRKPRPSPSHQNKNDSSRTSNTMRMIHLKHQEKWSRHSRAIPANTMLAQRSPPQFDSATSFLADQRTFSPLSVVVTDSLYNLSIDDETMSSTGSRHSMISGDSDHHVSYGDETFFVPIFKHGTASVNVDMDCSLLSSSSSNDYAPDSRATTPNRSLLCDKDDVSQDSGYPMPSALAIL
jgi:hypothetical protein